MAASFVSGGTTLTFALNPQRPASDLAVRQAQAKTAAGVRYGKDPIGSDQQIDLFWPGMPTADLAALLSFFALTGYGAASFTYTDPAGVAATVLFASSVPIRHAEVAIGVHRVSVTLRRS